MEVLAKPTKICTESQQTYKLKECEAPDLLYTQLTVNLL